MSPNVRRALHEALDLVLDAIAEDARGETSKVRRVRKPLPIPDVSKIAPDLKAKAERAFARAGL